MKQWCEAKTCEGRENVDQTSRAVVEITAREKNANRTQHKVCLCRHHNGFNNPIRLQNGDSVNPGTGEYIPR